MSFLNGFGVYKDESQINKKENTKLKILNKYVFSTVKRNRQVSKSVLLTCVLFLDNLSVCVYGFGKGCGE